MHATSFALLGSLVLSRTEALESAAGALAARIKPCDHVAGLDHSSQPLASVVDRHLGRTGQASGERIAPCSRESIEKSPITTRRETRTKPGPDYTDGVAGVDASNWARNHLSTTPTWISSFLDELRRTGIGPRAHAMGLAEMGPGGILRQPECGPGTTRPGILGHSKSIASTERTGRGPRF